MGVEIFFAGFFGGFELSRSIVDIDPIPVSVDPTAPEQVTLDKLADMVYLTFEAVKDLEAAFLAFTSPVEEVSHEE